MGHDGLLVVGGEVVVPGDGGHGAGADHVKHTVLTLGRVSRHVGVVSFGRLAKQLNVAVC